MRFDNPYQELRNMKAEDEKLYNWLLYSLNSIRRSKRDWVDIDLSNYFTLFIESWKPILLRKLIHIDLQLINMDGTFLKGFEMDLDSIFNNFVTNSISAFLTSKEENKNDFSTCEQ